MRCLTIALLAGSGFALTGCVAAIVPIAAAGAIGGKKVLDGGTPGGNAALPTKGSDHRPAEVAEARKTPTQAMIVPTAATPPTPASVPGGMQFLYGSGEAAAISLQGYYGLMNYLLAVSSDRAVGHPVQSVVLSADATLAATKFESCGDKPLALVLDIDETTLLNTGFEADQVARGGAYDPARWALWEQSATARQVEAVPGALSAVNVARGANITVIFNSNRQAAYADQTAALLAAAGFGKVVHGDTLWLQGDASTGGGSGAGKDARRAAISAKYCVAAMVGDQLGDFSDLFNAAEIAPAERRRLAASRDMLALWGHGWFMMPNPVYGTGLKGDLDTVFPADKRWTPTLAEESK